MSPCERHEDLIKDVAETKANTATILTKLQRLDEWIQGLDDRLYATHGATARVTGVLGGAMKTIGIATAIGGAVFAAIKLAV